MPSQTQTKSPATRSSGNDQTSGEMQPTQDFLDYLKAYARERPDVAALWCFGIGFVIGWKLKPW